MIKLELCPNCCVNRIELSVGLSLQLTAKCCCRVAQQCNAPHRMNRAAQPEVRQRGSSFADSQD